MALLMSSYDLKNKIFSFYSYVESINSSTNLSKCIYKLTIDIKELIRLINDIKITTQLRIDYDVLINNLENYIDIVNVIEDPLEIKDYILSDKEQLDNDFSYLTDIKDGCLNSNHFRYLKEYFLKTNNPCDIKTDILNTIALSLICYRSINLFYPECNCGENFLPFKNILDPINLYGIDIDDFLINNAKDYAQNIIKGTLKGSRISNKVFDVLFLNPRITLSKPLSYESKSLIENNEKYLLKNTLRYLRDGGVFIYTIPFYRMTTDMWLYIAKHINDASIIRHDDEQFKITIIGYKKDGITEFSDNFNYYKNLKYTQIDDYLSYSKQYIIPNKSLEVEFFRGSILDVKELELLIKNDGLYEDFFNNENKNNFQENNRPLIPFNLGQIGLILTSGQLDGVVEEVSDIKHVIKGMIIKNEFEYEKDSDKEGINTTVKTICNVVQINVLDANGKLKTLI